MKRSKVFILLLTVSLLVLSPAWQNPQDKRDIQAVLVKIVKDVTKRGGGTTGWQKAIPLDRLKSGYEVRTDAGSAALIRFADESKIIIRQNSIVQIKGQVQGKQILDRDVYMEKGKLSFNVKKQEKEQFRFSSPISVASIRGTGGDINSFGGDSASALCHQGRFGYRNTRSDREEEVGEGQVAFTYSDGSIRKRKATEDEINSSKSDIGGGTGGGTPGTPSDTTKTGRVQQPKQTKELIIYGEDNNGQQKKIILKIQQ